jgi:hypothetical protein
MRDQRLQRLLDQLRASQYRDLQGSTVSASIPLSERLLNEILAATVPATARVKDLALHPLAGNRLRVTARVVDFLPPLSLTLQIERQPQLPGGPLVLALPPVSGLLALGGAGLVGAMLPAGVRLEGQHIVVDVAEVLRRRGFEDVVRSLKKLELATEPGRLILRVDLAVD